jgi:hypothetical protein
MTGSPLELHARVFLCLGLVIALVLIGGGVSSADAQKIMAAAAIFVWMSAYFSVMRIFERDSNPQLIANALSVCLIYGTSGWIISLIGRHDYCHVMLAVDRRLFGETPASSLQRLASPVMNEILSLGYLSYHAYLFWYMLDAVRRPVMERHVFARPLLTAFGLGFSMYFVIPASGLFCSFPSLFEQPVRGYWITSFTTALVAYVAPRYDSFPSLHVFITAVMLCIDFVNFRQRFVVMLVPSALMLASTVLLRMHYTVDLIASAILLIPYVWYFIDWKRPPR